MKITSLHLTNFRSYSAKKWTFAADKVVFVGDNGRGKTNILEAISVASVAKSWREITISPSSNLPKFELKTNNLIQRNSENPALIDISTEENQYQIQIFPRKRVFKKNGKQIPRKNHLGQIPSLLFAPEHLEIFNAPKRVRQSFFDRFLCQIDEQYKETLTETLRVVKQKNAIFTSARQDFLTEKETEIQLTPWNKILEKNLPQIWKTRENFLAELEPLLQKELKKIAANDDEIKLFLTRCGKLSSNLPKFELELKARRSLFSPTRDDFCFHYRGQPVMNTVSRGEIRSILLALLSAKKQFYFAKTGQIPLLLLDDCFSELDDNRQQGLERLCEGTQAFFTTTHNEHFARFSEEVQKVEV